MSNTTPSLNSARPVRAVRATDPRPAMLRLSLLCAALGTAWLLVACGAKNEPQAAAPVQRQDPLVVNVKPEMAKNFQVQKVAQADLAPTQDIAGRIEANDRQVTRIGASVTGRVTEVLAEVGDRVKPGQALAYVASPELTTAQLGYLRANAASQLAERAVERARQLIQADVIGSAELQRRESELSIARAELRAAGDQLRLMGLGQAAIDKLRTDGTLAPQTAVLATLSGVVIERKVSSGQVAQPGDPLFTVADLGNVWVVGGGDLLGQFDDAGLLDELIVQVAPVTLGAGTPLFPRRVVQPPLQLQSVTTLGGVFAELRYRVPPRSDR